MKKEIIKLLIITEPIAGLDKLPHKRTKREGELSNIVTVLRLELEAMELGRRVDEEIYNDIEELRSRVEFLIRNPDCPGKHCNYSDEQGACDDYDKIDDL